MPVADGAQRSRCSLVVKMQHTVLHVLFQAQQGELQSAKVSTAMWSHTFLLTACRSNMNKALQSLVSVLTQRALINRCSGVAGRVCGVAVALPDLWRTRAPVGVEQGVDLTPCNAALGQPLATMQHLLPPVRLLGCTAKSELDALQYSCRIGTHWLSQ